MQPDNQAEGIIDWRRREFGTGKIYAYIDAGTKEVWLNLDWDEDEKRNTHHGGRFYPGHKYIVVRVGSFVKTPLNEPENAESMTTLTPAKELADMSLPSSLSIVEKSNSEQPIAPSPSLQYRSSSRIWTNRLLCVETRNSKDSGNHHDPLNCYAPFSVLLRFGENNKQDEMRSKI